MKHYIFGMLIVTVVTLCAMWAAAMPTVAAWHLNGVTIAILLGFAVGNGFAGRIKSAGPGIHFAKGTLLRLGIILYGFNLTLQDITDVGINAVVTDAVMLCSTFMLTCFIGLYCLNIDKQTVWLTATGCSICGAAAVLGVQTVIKGDSHKVAISVAVVVIFGSIAMFVYPVLYEVWPALSDNQFGIYIGSSVHEVAQVYTAGKVIGNQVADVAVISKMIRVIMLAPCLMLLSCCLCSDRSRRVNVPWFALCFILTALINSSGRVPPLLVNIFSQASSVLLIMAMAAMGLSTQVSSLRQAGFKPLLLGGAVFLWLTAGGFAVNYVMQRIVG